MAFAEFLCGCGGALMRKLFKQKMNCSTIEKNSKIEWLE